MLALLLLPIVGTRALALSGSAGNHLAQEVVSSSSAELDRLRAIQRAVRDGECTNTFEERKIEEVGGKHSATYGEITPRGFETLARRLQLASEDTFADLGSGLGRTVQQAARDYDVKRSVGIELSDSRHRLALAALEKERPAPFVDRCELICGDIADEAMWSAPLQDVTCIFFASLLMSPELMRRVGDRIEASEDVRAVASLKRWKPENGGLGGFVEQAECEYCETSWTAPLALVRADGSPAEEAGEQPKGSKVYIYLRDERTERRPDPVDSTSSVAATSFSCGRYK